jgi:diguanylate cyclase (GGDEF)-like protein/PAS domain S-box-containing protein
MDDPAGSTGQSQTFLLQVLDTLPAAAYTCDVTGLITYCNRNAVDVWGRTPRINDPADRFCGSYRLYYADGRLMPHDECWMARTLRDQASYNGQEVVIEQPNGAIRWALAHANPMLDAEGRLLGASNVLVDITERKRIEEQLAYQATHDALTGLANRSKLLQALEQALADAGRRGEPFALILLDLDGFKRINDTFGHEAGDEVLGQMRPRLQKVVSKQDLVARLGGDEFGILLRGADEHRARRVGAAILASIGLPLTVGGRRVTVGASLGVATWPDRGRGASELLRHADMAMYAAKRSRSGLEVYAEARPGPCSDERSLACELAQAIEQGALELHYQPIVDLASWEVVGVEALVRWPHPERSLIHPVDLMPLVESHGLSKHLDHWVFVEAMRQQRAWRDRGLVLELSVNLSSESLLDDRFLNTMLEIIEESPPYLMTVELSERSVVSDPHRAQQALDRFRALGVRVALDDYGTGYSGLDHVKLLTVDEVKLDSSFVRGLPGSATDARIAEAVLSLSHALGLVVTAEGAEDEEALDWLVEHGCDRVQGFCLSEPLPPDRLVAWLGTHW